MPWVLSITQLQEGESVTLSWLVIFTRRELFFFFFFLLPQSRVKNNFHRKLIQTNRVRYWE